MGVVAKNTSETVPDPIAVRKLRGTFEEVEGTGILAVIEQDLPLIWRIQDLCGDCGLKLNIARSAEEAICYLRGIGIYSDRALYPLPGIILLDTENRAAGDLAILQWLRENANFNQVPVALLADETPHPSRATCAIDATCFIVDRNTLWEFPSLAWQLLFSPKGNSSLSLKAETAAA